MANSGDYVSTLKALQSHFEAILIADPDIAAEALLGLSIRATVHLQDIVNLVNHSRAFLQPVSIDSGLSPLEMEDIQPEQTMQPEQPIRPEQSLQPMQPEPISSQPELVETIVIDEAQYQFDQPLTTQGTTSQTRPWADVVVSGYSLFSLLCCFWLFNSN